MNSVSRSLMKCVAACWAVAAVHGCASGGPGPHRQADAGRATPTSEATMTAESRSMPTSIATTGITNFYRDGRIYIAGAVEPAAIAELKARGVQTVVDMRLPEQVPAEYAAQLREAGIRYVGVPIRSDRLTPDQAEAFLRAMDPTGDAPVLLQCSAGNRAAAMYGVWLGARDGCTVGEAIDRARAAGLRNDQLAADVGAYLDPSPAPRE